MTSHFVLLSLPLFAPHLRSLPSSFAVPRFGSLHLRRPGVAHGSATPPTESQPSSLDLGSRVRRWRPPRGTPTSSGLPMLTLSPARRRSPSLPPTLPLRRRTPLRRLMVRSPTLPPPLRSTATPSSSTPRTPSTGPPLPTPPPALIPPTLIPSPAPALTLSPTTTPAPASWRC